MHSECPVCDGLGFEVVLVSQWEEDPESPRECGFCGGTGLIPFRGGNDVVSS